MRLKWDASPWLLVPVPFLAAAAASLWIAAVLQAIGVGRPLDAVVRWLNAIAGPEPAEGRSIIALALFFGLPAIAFALAFFAFLGGELAIADWTIDARLRLPRPPWRLIDAVGATLLLLTTLLVLAMAAHGISG
jgi:hypothetical protein